MNCGHVTAGECTDCALKRFQKFVEESPWGRQNEVPICDRCREPKCARCGGPLHPNYLRSGWCTNGGLNR